MTYLTIQPGVAQPARRVDFAQFAELFAVPEAAPQRPRRRGRMPLAAPLLLLALAADLVMIARPTTLACAAQLSQLSYAPCAATRS